MERIEWGPGPAQQVAMCAVQVRAMPRAAFLDAVGQVRAALGVPVQPVRVDRVVSALHVKMARWHAERAARDGRARSEDPAVEFLLYMAADRQISRALADLGFSGDGAGVFLVVALGDVDDGALARVVGARFEAEAVPWQGPGEAGDGVGDAARGWWAKRLALSDVAPVGDVEDAVLAAMADLAVARL